MPCRGSKVKSVTVCMKCVGYLHIVEDTPSTVRVSGAQTLPTSGVLLAAFHWDSNHLGGERERMGYRERKREVMKK